MQSSAASLRKSGLYGGQGVGCIHLYAVLHACPPPFGRMSFHILRFIYGVCVGLFVRNRFSRFPRRWYVWKHSGPSPAFRYSDAPAAQSICSSRMSSHLARLTRRISSIFSSRWSGRILFIASAQPFPRARPSMPSARRSDWSGGGLGQGKHPVRGDLDRRCSSCSSAADKQKHDSRSWTRRLIDGEPHAEVVGQRRELMMTKSKDHVRPAVCVWRRLRIGNNNRPARMSLLRRSSSVKRGTEALRRRWRQERCIPVPPGPFGFPLPSRILYLGVRRAYNICRQYRLRQMRVWIKALSAAA